MTDLEAWRDALWKVYQDNHTYVRHHEVQRSTVATLIIAIASAALAIATFDQALTPVDLPLLAVVTALGIFGIFFSKKQYERTCLHIDRADALVKELQKTLDKSVLEITGRSDALHKQRFKALYPFGVNRMWAIFYSFIAAVGAVSILIALS